LNITFTGPGSQTVTAPTRTVNAAYNALSSGLVDVPSGAATGSSYDIPMGSVGSAATFVAVTNLSGVDCSVLIGAGGNDVQGEVFELCNGGLFAQGGPTGPAGMAFSNMQLELKAHATGPGTIEYYVFGDPV
jgi:hypothetical protein